MANLVLGPSGGNGGHAFEEYAIPADGKVQEIRVNAGFYVDGLQLVCVDSAGVVTELPHLGGRSGFHHTITLDADEYLTGISGRSGRYIDSIRFHTNKRTSDSIGGRGGENEYHFEAAANGEVASFFGRADWYVDQVGVVLRDRAAGASAAALAQPSAAPARKTTKSAKAAPSQSEPSVAAVTTAPPVKAAPAKATKTKAAEAVAAAATIPAAKPAAKSRKKTATESELVAIPDSAPVPPAAPDFVAIPDSGVVPPPAPDLIGIPQSTPLDATRPEYIGIPGSAPVDVDSAAIAAGTRTTSVDLGATSPADDLTKIEGIGPKIAQVLADTGITTFAALASTSVERLREILNTAGSRYRITDPSTWPEQAAHAARGDWDAFDALVAKLKAGKRA